LRCSSAHLTEASPAPSPGVSLKLDADLSRKGRGEAVELVSREEGGVIPGEPRT
jgi:hypothetical protein